MSDTQTPTVVQSESPSALVQALVRISNPLLIFSGVLTAVLLLSWGVLLPRLSVVEVLGQTRRIDELPGLKASLMASLEQKEQERTNLVMPLQQKQFESLKQERQNAASDAVRTEVLAAARSASPDGNAVSVNTFIIDLVKKTATVSGDVHGVGLQSMTVLAGFVDSVSHLSSVTAVSPSPFTRTGDSAATMHSPFTLRLTLR